MSDVIRQDTSLTEGDAHTLHYVVRLPQPVDKVWPALADPDGLGGWLAPARPFEPRLGGAVALNGLGEGRTTAWDVERIAEYTLEGYGRLRFHLEPGDGHEYEHEHSTILRFTHTYEGPAPPPPWRERFERLVRLLEAAGPS